MLDKEPSEKARDIEKKDIARKKKIDHGQTNLRKSSSTRPEDEQGNIRPSI